MQEIREVRGRDALSSYGWLWLVGWAKSRDVELPTELLVGLFEEWSDVFVKTSVLDLAIRTADYQPLTNFDLPIADFPNEFLRRVMLSAVRVEREEYPDFREIPKERGDEILRAEAVPEMGRSESLLVSLLQAGRPITLGAASSFLRHEWQGQRHMQIFFWLMFDKLDGESQAAWRRSIPRMPYRPEDRSRQ
ncbi:hypothetical protein [Tunturiibacter gelidoferens]|uniref:Uncharacterized protein n=1 Tax=Tunturiibacter gelidiferens TaxID=3069689 RepID=A0ACC5P3Q0_9BACT|nr:hypothetical protein [Edaphobacter lichenicola]MBB5341468.1 hypothetical protein [Edaphobacter lichenicola]